ncbi:hypothetical protein DM02DRAFT_594241 [Periconia macrospinosa]|uniref:GRF-type domain-containing protein n=1 Tax=Periconia macrospinosa TaxID=97972 RepID=A0A2V1DNT3_9PLEO|nr:hypothetical protein DM02DRAFT_594241 [Periconia macrospinosa]
MSASKGGKGYRGPPKPRGSFLDGIWYCDCNPPLPAIHFPVKKAGPNKGRWFRTCQKEQSDDSRCKFFLWDTDAAPREKAALANNSRTEPGRANAVTPSRTKAVSPPSPLPPASTSSNSTRKRMRASYQSDDEDEYGFGDNTATFDEELDNIVTAVETPSKKARIEDAFTTPKRRKLPWQKDEPSSNTYGLQTPQTENRALANPFTTKAPLDIFTTPSKPTSLDAGSIQTMTPSSSPMETPTPSRFKSVATEGDVVRDIFGVLSRANVKLDEQTTRDITAVLSKYVTLSEGVKKGRDVARASVKAKDAKITELTYRVNTLEAELEAERATVAHLQWRAEHEEDLD